MLAIVKTTVRSLVDGLRTRIVDLGNSKDKLNQWEAFWCKRVSKTRQVTEKRPGREEIGAHTHDLQELDFGNIQASSFLS